MLVKTLTKTSLRRSVVRRHFRRDLPGVAKIFLVLGMAATLFTALWSAHAAATQLRGASLEYGGFGVNVPLSTQTRGIVNTVKNVPTRLDNINNAAGQLGNALAGSTQLNTKQFSSMGIGLGGGAGLKIPLPQPLAQTLAAGSGMLGAVSNLVSAAFGPGVFGGMFGGWGAGGDAGARKNTYLGPAFAVVAGYGESAQNASLAARGGHFLDAGVGDINAILYNVKDYLKYIAGSIAILWLMVSAAQLVTADSDDGIGKAKTGVMWSLGGLAVIFMIDFLVIAVLDAGGNDPGQAIHVGAITSQLNGDGSTNANYGVNSDFFNNMTTFFTQNIRETFNYLKILTGAFSLLFIVVAGFRMVTTAGDDSEVEKEKGYLMHVLTAFVTLLMLDQLIFNFIYPIGTDGAYDAACVEYLANGYQSGGCTSAAQLAQSGSQSILSMVRFFESLVGAVAVFFMVYAGIKIIVSFGDEEVISSNKKTVLWSVGGLAVIMLSDVVVRKFFFVSNPGAGTAAPSVASGLQLLGGVTNFFATFIGIFSFVSLLIAGVFWVANFGNSDIGDKAKGIILHAAIGIVVSVSAYAIVNTLIGGSAT